MVRGLEKWKEHFAAYADNYVLIGGAACNLLEEEYAQNPRATKDLDLILVVEVLNAEFGRRFWDFVKQGGYRSRQRIDDKHECYRFMNPEDVAYPKQLELFSRKAGLLQLPEEARIEPIHIEDGLSSLSAILMNDDYYNFTIEHSILSDGIHIANVEALICLKARAYNDLRARKEAGEVVDGRDIEKHKKDVFRLAAMIPADSVYALPETLKDDLEQFCDSVADNLPNADFMKSIGLPGMDCDVLLDIVRRSFSI